MSSILMAMPWETAAMVPPSCSAASSYRQSRIRLCTASKLSQTGTCQRSGSLLKLYICSGQR